MSLRCTVFAFFLQEIAGTSNCMRVRPVQKVIRIVNVMGGTDELTAVVLNLFEVSKPSYVFIASFVKFEILKLPALKIDRDRLP
jgi:hypothetical protein